MQLSSGNGVLDTQRCPGYNGGVETQAIKWLERGYDKAKAFGSRPQRPTACKNVTKVSKAGNGLII